jgi:hypothetical protein
MSTIAKSAATYRISSSFESFQARPSAIRIAKKKRMLPRAPLDIVSTWAVGVVASRPETSCVGSFSACSSSYFLVATDCFYDLSVGCGLRWARRFGQFSRWCKGCKTQIPFGEDNEGQRHL